jgi:hypothetical protein
MLPAAAARVFTVAPDSPATPFKGFPTMTPQEGATGFCGQSAPVASTRLIDAVAASLALGALSLCVVVAVTVLLTIKAVIA